MTITLAEAWQIFAADTDMFENVVNNVVTAPMEQHEYDAFVSICHNIGETQFTSATFVKSFNEGADVHDVTAEILWWNEPPEIVPRRQGEAVQFRDAFYVARIDPMPAPSEA
jgi:lysozyme